MAQMYRVGCYVKLAKLWEKRRKEAYEYHTSYYHAKYDGVPDIDLKEIYIDITGQKQVYKRPEMIRLLLSCSRGEIDLIATQSRAYLAPNSESFCFLLKYLFDLPYHIDIVSDDSDMKIDTIINADSQRESLQRMANSYVSIASADYEDWRTRLLDAMAAIDEKE